jgi:hypothetical protein
VDRAFELKRLAKSLLLNFLELIGIMSINPEQVSSLAAIGCDQIIELGDRPSHHHLKSTI